MKQIIRQHFPEMDEEEKLLIKLLEKDATTKKGAIRMRITKFVESLIKSERLRKTKSGRIYLTDIGYGIACGAKRIYSE